MLDPSPPAATSTTSATDQTASFAPFDLIPGNVPDCSAPGLLLLCDHASNAFPEGFGTLGMPAAELKRHIAYDIGAAAVTRGLAARLGAPAILSKYSRLFIDLNRGADDPTLVMRLSDGAVVPGNRDVGATEIAHRIATYHAPYHAAIDRMIDAAMSGDDGQMAMKPGSGPVLLSIHSFTDRWKTTDRPWHITVLWDHDDRFPRPLINALKAEQDLCVDENEPYSGSLAGDCMYTHGTQRRLAHALIEIRQDLITSEAGQAAWVGRLGRIIENIWQDGDLVRTMRTVAGPRLMEKPA